MEGEEASSRCLSLAQFEEVLDGLLDVCVNAKRAAQLNRGVRRSGSRFRASPTFRLTLGGVACSDVDSAGGGGKARGATPSGSGPPR